ncbi:ferric reductase-like transmembrane domain-containing protein [Pullulanibacillus sp. KACC 23026]|uniref:ferric reductase-like transmembrane domain-containing protein n=1 Tax=Pullulanibacillus sp. KACC 23026 TaxID=3028315 RepID=UPI0023B0F149|nr:ferric reductase-like transmembrane domain-containing protein [Pullulanibacillus sp. KACC 23026]WEG12092.1 ferric reductase-like transmembrane domain-containing protein [Pullulanibacillus sp. KACC 23026]
MQNFLQLFDTWHLIRLFGWLAYFFFSMSLVFGMLSRMSSFKKKWGLFSAIHMSSSWAGLFATLGHILILIVDSYQPYTIKEIFIPFVAQYDRIASGLGTLAFFIIVIVLFTSDVMRSKMNKKVWKRIHLMVFPAWLLMLIHGVVMGSDTKTVWGTSVYWISGIIIIILFLVKSMNRGTVHRKTVSDRSTAS